MSYDPTQQVPPSSGSPSPSPEYTQYPRAYPPPAASYPPPDPMAYAPYNAAQVAAPGAGFDFGRFWRSLGRPGQVCVIAGLVLLVSFFFSWFNAGLNCTGTLNCSDQRIRSYLWADPASASGFVMAGGGAYFRIHIPGGLFTAPVNIDDQFSFPLLWLVLLASLAFIVLPVLMARGKIVPSQGRVFILIVAGLSLLFEIIYAFNAPGAFPQAKTYAQDNLNGNDGTIRVFSGTDVGFWVGLLATLAAGGIYLYAIYQARQKVHSALLSGPYQQIGAATFRRPAQYMPPAPMPPYPGSSPAPFQQMGQYPGAQPHQPRSPEQ